MLNATHFEPELTSGNPQGTLMHGILKEHVVPGLLLVAARLEEQGTRLTPHSTTLEPTLCVVCAAELPDGGLLRSEVQYARQHRLVVQMRGAGKQFWAEAQEEVPLDHVARPAALAGAFITAVHKVLDHLGQVDRC